MKPDSYLLDWETLSTLGAVSFIVTSSKLEETAWRFALAVLVLVCLGLLVEGITLSKGGLDGGKNHEGKRREEEKGNIVEGESSANRGCLQVSIWGKCDGLLGQNEVNLSFTSNLNPLGLERWFSRYDLIDQLFHNKLLVPSKPTSFLSKPHSDFYLCSAISTVRLQGKKQSKLCLSMHG